jgi:hypothetical protein
MNEKNKLDAIKSNMSLFEDFNRISKGFISLLENQLKSKKKKTKRLSIMVSELKLPENHNSVTVEIIDINNTRGVSRHKVYKNKMPWETDIHKKKGPLI